MKFHCIYIQTLFDLSYNFFTIIDDNAVVFAYHLYSAGTTTTAHTLSWILLMMCIHQDSQTKVFTEIENQIGM